MTLSYVLFLVLETLRPGFVVTTFSPHWFLGAALIFAAVDARSGQLSEKGSRIALVPAVMFGIVAGVLTWSLGKAFGDARLFLALAAAVLPVLSILVRRSLRS